MMTTAQLYLLGVLPVIHFSFIENTEFWDKLIKHTVLQKLNPYQLSMQGHLKTGSIL